MPRSPTRPHDRPPVAGDQPPANLTRRNASRAPADGKIELDEFLNMLEALDTGLGRDEARIGFSEIDTDHDDSISLEEFIDWWTER